jgi:hypothetical protein|tara:strand:+ start:586 stop:879 length:294 start_codon:yes stop_codon:yes gene_type:complete
MKFTLDVENKTIQIHGSFTQKDLSEIFNVLNIKNINEYIIETKPLLPSVSHKSLTKPRLPFWSTYSSISSGTPTYELHTTLDNDLKIVYNNIREELY